MNFRWIDLRFVSLMIMTSSLSGCMIGPDFHPPKPETPERYTETALPRHTAATPRAGKGGNSQEFVYNQDIIPADWWHLFRSPVINDLVVRGINQNPNLTSAYAALRQAQENYNATIGNLLFPAFDFQAQVQRQRYSAAAIGSTSASTIFNVWNVGIPNLTYTLDVLGGSRRQIEEAGAQVDYQQFLLIGTYLTLTSNIVTTAVTIASLQAQLDASRLLLKDQQDQLNILRSQFRLGGVAMTNVLTQQTLVSQTAATIPPLEKNLSLNRHALAVLVGAYPNEMFPQVRLSALHLPGRLPVSLPSNLVRQRPDIRASEALLHAASAQIGVATANLFPQVTLSAAYGWESLNTGQLFGPASETWLTGLSILQPVFHGGALLAARRAAIAAYDQAFAQYKLAVLQGFQNVADTLRAIETDARTLRAQQAAEDAAKESLVLTKQQYKLGGVDYLQLLTAQQQYQQTVISRIQAQAARYTDTVALYQSLGGSWWNKSWCTKQCLYEK
jgi:NodT family efflux transporter outer membrane factor (OMF) lipoprotein